MILILQTQLFEAIGRMDESHVRPSVKVSDGLRARLSNDFFNDAFTEAGGLVFSELKKQVENANDELGRIRNEVLADQRRVIESKSFELQSLELLSDDERLSLVEHVFLDIQMCYINQLIKRPIRIYEHMLKVYMEGHFPCGISFPKTDKEWFDQELLELCELEYI